MERGLPAEPEPRRAGGDRARGDEGDLDALAITCASSAARGSIRAGSGPAAGSAMRPLPTLTTTRRSAAARHARVPPRGPGDRRERRAERRPERVEPLPRPGREGKHGEPAPPPEGQDAGEARRRALEVRLVRGDQLRARGQLGRVRLELRLDRPPVVDRVAARGRVEVEEVDQEARALEVPEEAEPEALALGGARDQPRHVRDDEAPLLGEPDQPERRDERRERIVGDLRAGGREAGHQRGLARVRKAHDADVGQEPELEPEPALLAGFAGIRVARRASRGGGEAGVAPAPAPAPGDGEPLAMAGEIAEEEACVPVPHRRADGDAEHEVAAAGAVPVGALAVAPARRGVVAAVSEVEEGAEAFVGLEDHRAAAAAVASVRAARGARTSRGGS